MNLASIVSLALSLMIVFLPASAGALICDVHEAMGFSYWAEDVQGEGSMEIEPSAAVQAGSVATFNITYVAGPKGLPAGASVELVTPRGCSAPRIGDASRPSGITAQFDGNPLRLRSVPKADRRFPGTRIAAEVPQSGLPPGARLVFTWNDASITSEINNLDDAFLELFLLERQNADAAAVLLPQMAKIRLLPGDAAALDVFAPSAAVIGKSARAVVRARDRFGNPAVGYRGTVRLAATDDTSLEPSTYTFTEADRGAHAFENAAFSREGIAFLRAADDEAGLSAQSNPVEVLPEAPELRLYWGDIHVHTVMSWDAWFGAQSVVGYEQAYKMGRDFARLDFQANTDHDAPNPYSDREWKEMIQTTNRFNEPGRFATLIAIENSGPTGDKNVYWRGGDAPYIVAEKRDPIALFEKLKAWEALIIPHHVAQSMRPTDWRPDYFEPEKERLLEIFSNHGRAEYYGNIPHFSYHPEPTMKGYTYQDALARGYKLGIAAASDEHRGKVGSVGLTGVWASELTRDAIYDAMNARRCYGTTNPRIILHFTADGHQMGEEFTSAGPVSIEAHAIGSAKLLSAEVIKNGEVAYVAYPQKVQIWDHSERAREIAFQWTDRDLNRDSYYYLRVTQAPDPDAEEQWGFPPQMNFAWSSPVWVTHRDVGRE